MGIDQTYELVLYSRPADRSQEPIGFIGYWNISV